MSFKEINDLRKAGNLDEALQMVNRDLESEPDSIWIKRAASWVYYAYIKENAKPESYEAFMEYLHKLKELDMN